MLIVIVLLATVLLRAGIVAAVVYLILPNGFACPRCASKLIAIWRPLLRRLVPAIEHRWCMRCGWSGIVKRARERRKILTETRITSDRSRIS